MNIINEFTAKVVYIEYDDKKDCYLASIDKSVPVPVWNGNSVQYEKHGSFYIELATVDCSNLEVGDIITISTIEHYPGEQIELFGGEYHTFESAGTSNIIIKIESSHNEDFVPDIDCEDYDEAAQENWHATMEEHKEAEKAIIAQEYLRNYMKPCALDPNEEGASNSFAGAMAYASNVFMNRLILGGAYSTNQDDKMIILEHLKAIMDIIAKYQK